MSLQQLLEILSDGEFHSGEQLGSQMGVSRSAVWKQLKKLQEIGVDHYSVKGRGYRVPGGLDLLCTQRLASHLSGKAAAELQTVELQLSTGSTNALALDGVSQGRKQGNLYLAECQTAGRGRRGRSWVSPFARNLYFSLSWTFTEGAAALEGLSLAVGLAISKGLENYGVQDVTLKWPNDLLHDRKKLAGVLLEMTGDASGVCQVVIGAGINVSMSDNDADRIDQPWTDVKRAMSIPASESADRNYLLAEILNELIPALQRFSVQGFEPFRENWMKRDAFLGQKVVLQTQNQQLQGVEQGVDEKGALQLKTEDGIQAFHGGELSLRLQQ
ncbi:bifunctional biotin--[acetyl-CoA-carboxylase] ligase/biotin operon repressor BirA [Motiliproteus sp. MSK22-1]|uniref:bifunctional biotin--[acetyl-CoA-carboxylase] ligase/biotin operon repressor BirA n=1 Tax=Motiliproteus sp. MSK22-1 TaxID=1897630 RepID=UPI000976A506|nr:bifunctional biotin--[acetyl-CoA-carboxylase] ligase/biotin operon repressor BirA [Motiliproteus sp. MSK22-1]OMH39005.1 biotin--[acetyl-CoA-carboxylase] ligase [Motiliproteus sp. MSK22-1]